MFFQLFFVGFVSAEIISVLFPRLGATDSQIKISSGETLELSKIDVLSED